MSLKKNIQATEKLLEIIRKPQKKPTTAISNIAPKRKKVTKQIRVGIAINKNTVHLTAISHDEQYRLLGYQQATLSSQHPKIIGEELAPLLRKFCAPFPKCELWYEMSPDNVDLMYYEIPQVSAKDLDSTAFWTAQKEKKIDTTTHIFDYHLLGEKEENNVKKYRVFAYTAPRKEVEEWKTFVRKIGYPLKGMSITSFGLQNMYQTKWLDVPQESSSAHVYVGNDWSRIDIFYQNNLVFSRDVKTGINSILTEIQDSYRPLQTQTPQIETKDTEDGTPENVLEIVPGPGRSSFNLSKEQAKAILMSQIVDGEPLLPEAPGAELTPKEILNSIRPAIDRLLRQIQRTVSHYNNTMGLTPVEKIFISGTMSLYPPLIVYIEEELGFTVEACDPFQDGRHQSEQLPLPPTLSQRSVFLPAIGLALSSNYRTSNFLFTYKEKNNEKKLQLINKGILAAGILLLLLTFGLNAAAIVYLNGKKSTLTGLEKKYASLEQNQSVIEEQIRTTDPGMDLAGIREVAQRIEALNRHLENSAVRYAPVALLSEFFSLTPEGIAIHKVLYSAPMTPVNLIYNRYQQSIAPRETQETFNSPFGFFKLQENQNRPEDRFTSSQFILLDGIITTNKQDKNLSLAVYKMLLNNSPFFQVMDIEKNSQITPGIGNSLHFTMALKVTL